MEELRFETQVLKLLFVICSMITALVTKQFHIVPEEISEMMARNSISGAAALCISMQDDLKGE